MRKKVEKFADVLDASDFPWPKKGDKLFKRSQRWDGGVGFCDHPYARDADIWDGYARQFRLARDAAALPDRMG